MAQSSEGGETETAGEGKRDDEDKFSNPRKLS
jgi:hypothetical protein